METKHTKGQWSLPHFVSNDKTKCDCGYIFAHDCEVSIGAVYYKRDNSIEYSEYPEKEEAIANAKLICAAPDLLKALTAFVDNVDNWLKTGIPADSKTSKALYNKAKNAIRKATK